MAQVFKHSGGGELGASLAVIMAHSAPFMGAQTTMIQRYFLPNPFDAIVSQPFGMLEDLFGLAIAQAQASPILASASVTMLVFVANLLCALRFSMEKDTRSRYKAAGTAFVNFWLGLLFYHLLCSQI